jgi:hypothetical protein
MRYFVVLDSGEEYGPYEISEMNQWISEGRIEPTSVLRPETSEVKLAASTLPGLEWQTGQTFDAYSEQKIDTSPLHLRGSWACFIASLVLCCLPTGFHLLAGIAGIWLSWSAFRSFKISGEKAWIAPMVLNFLLLCVWLFSLFLFGSMDLRNLLNNSLVKSPAIRSLVK